MTFSNVAEEFGKVDLLLIQEQLKRNTDKLERIASALEKISNQGGI